MGSRSTFEVLALEELALGSQTALGSQAACSWALSRCGSGVDPDDDMDAPPGLDLGVSPDIDRDVNPEMPGG